MVDGVPSVGAEVMVGNGQLGVQPTQAANHLPAPPGSGLSGSSQTGGGSAAKSGATADRGGVGGAVAAALGLLAGFLGAAVL